MAVNRKFSATVLIEIKCPRCGSDNSCIVSVYNKHRILTIVKQASKAHTCLDLLPDKNNGNTKKVEGLQEVK